MEFNTILVPVDFSDNSLHALKIGEELARRFSSTLHLIHSYPIEPPVMAPYAPAVPPTYIESLRDAAQEHLSSWRKEHCDEDLQVVEHLSMKPPSEAIVDLAEEISADVIIMGTRGITGLKHVLLGSVAERTVRHAKCPVLTVKD